MHHFQLKPVRSLDSLRPAWSGHLRHGPPPSTVIANPRAVSSTKPILSSSRPLPLDNSINRSNAILNTPDTIISETAKALKSSSTKPNIIEKEANETSSLSVVASVCNQIAEPNRFLHESHIHNNLLKTIDSSACACDKDSAKSEEFSSRNEKSNSKDILTNIDPIPSTWDSELYDKSFVTSSFLHEASENDPFDTSRVFMPPYLQTPLFNSTIPSMPVQFHHPLPHPFNATSCCAHAKVNIVTIFFPF